MRYATDAELARPHDDLTDRPDCDHCQDQGCRECDPDSRATPRAWLR